MFEKLLKEWAKAEGFETWSQDHAAVLCNLARWLDKRAPAQPCPLDAAPAQGENYPCPNCVKLSKVSPCKYGPGYICENGHIFERRPAPPLMEGNVVTQDNAPAQDVEAEIDGKKCK